VSGSGAPASHRGARRILFVTHTSEWIGPNVSLLELLTRLPSHLVPFVAVPSAGRLTEELAERSLPFERVRLDKYGILPLANLIRRHEAALVYGNSVHGASRNALIAAKLCRVPFIYHLREIASAAQRRRGRLFGWADGAVAVSRATADSYGGAFRVAPVVIYNGVSLERFGRRRGHGDETRQSLGIPARAPVILHVGNVYARKGQLQAVDAFRQLRRRVPEAHMVLAGRLDRDPDYVSAVREAIDQPDIGGRVLLLGLWSGIERLMATSDVLLHTATQDPHPRAVIEAMASELPVVALDVDGVGETVVDGVTGYLIKPPGTAVELGDALARVLENEQLRASMGEAGRGRVAQCFSAGATASAIADFIDRTIGA